MRAIGGAHHTESDQQRVNSPVNLIQHYCEEVGEQCNLVQYNFSLHMPTRRQRPSHSMFKVIYAKTQQPRIKGFRCSVTDVNTEEPLQVSRKSAKWTSSILVVFLN